MADVPNVAGMVADPDFQGLAPADKRAALGKLTGDSSFSGLSDAETMQFISKFPQPSATPPVQQSKGISIPSNASISAQPSFWQRIKSAAGQGGAVGVGEELAKTTLNPLLGSQAKVPGTGVTVGDATRNAQQMGNIGLTMSPLIPGGAVESAAARIPSAARAGMNINRIVTAASDVPVKTYEATAEALRAKELADSGLGAMPKGLNNFLKRVMNPERPPITLEEARDFYKGASKLSADEAKAIKTPELRRQIAQFTNKLGQNIESALNSSSPGQGTMLRQALDEYHQAMVMKETAIKGLKWLGGAAVGAGSVAGGTELAKWIWNRNKGAR